MAAIVVKDDPIKAVVVGFYVTGHDRLGEVAQGRFGAFNFEEVGFG
jgi:hypothetical protein